MSARLFTNLTQADINLFTQPASEICVVFVINESEGFLFVWMTLFTYIEVALEMFSVIVWGYEKLYLCLYS